MKFSSCSSYFMPDDIRADRYSVVGQAKKAAARGNNNNNNNIYFVLKFGPFFDFFEMQAASGWCSKVK